jgi:hypothetical protein
MSTSYNFCWNWLPIIGTLLAKVKLWNSQWTSWQILSRPAGRPGARDADHANMWVTKGIRRYDVVTKPDRFQLPGHAKVFDPDNVDVNGSIRKGFSLRNIKPLITSQATYNTIFKNWRSRGNNAKRVFYNLFLYSEIQDAKNILLKYWETKTWKKSYAINGLT